MLGVMNQIISSIAAASFSSSINAPLLRDELLPEIFTATAGAARARIAAHFGDETRTYGQLDAEANRVAAALRQRGIGRGSFVGLWMARSLDLHVALLGILKSGAAYLPFDFDAPAERVAACLVDCQAAALIVDSATEAKAGTPAAPVLRFAELATGRLDLPAPDLRADGMTSADAAYVIYTSGSTGTPKGVVISHRNICHYLRAANTVYGVEARDVVFQGASVAFDLSLEEFFLPYLVGARMWIASREVLQETDRLAEVMSKAGITVLSAVPTLLAMLSAGVPSLRLIVLGGEACPPALVERWYRPGRRILNSYGPTESTVVATVAELHPSEPVTIGRPLPNYSCYVVDEGLNLVPPGAEGELLIGGPGVAGGYLNRPELTAAKFIANPFHRDGGDPILYRSGDAVSIDGEGRLLFHGRIDDQVKIRGYRVELGEIEARLSNCAGVAQAAVVLRHEDGADRLVAFVVARAGAEIDRSTLQAALKPQLPSYMVPSHYECVEVLPRLISGKVDRKALQKAELSAVESEPQEQPRTSTEAVLLAAAQRVFPGQALPLEADFFIDLGGHSLLAARFVSAVRETPALAGLTLQDVYAARSLRAMSARLDARLGERPAGDQSAVSQAFEPPPLWRRFFCGLAQAAVLPIILTMTTAPWLAVFIVYQFYTGDTHNFPREMAAILLIYTVVDMAIAVIAIAAKWLVIGRTKPGRYPLWGFYYFRWWLAKQFVGMVHISWLQGTPLARIFMRLLGAKVSGDALIGQIIWGTPDLINIGKGTTVGASSLVNAEVVGNELIIGCIDIGDDVQVGTSCIIGRDAKIGEGAELADLTMLPEGTVVGAWERWEGSPGRLVGRVDADKLPAPATAGPLRKGILLAAYALMLVLLPPISLIPIIPAFYLLDSLSDGISSLFNVSYLYFLPVLAWPTGMVLVAVTVLLIAALRWSVLPRVKPGTYSVHSFFYLRKWIVALAAELTLETLHSLYATVYMCMWYRLMGAKIGKDTEISSDLAARYDLTEFGEKSFIADVVMLGDDDTRRGWMVLKPLKIGSRVFVGNNAVVQPGADIPDGCLIGIKSRPPANEEMAPGDTWFGSPPIKLPVRQRFDDVAANWTFEPSRWRRFGRAVFEAFRVSLPTMLFVTFGTLVVEALAPSILQQDYGRVIPVFMATSVTMSIIITLVVIGLKWALMGTYRPTAKPMWSWWALRTEAIAVVYNGLAGKLLLERLVGTPMLPWVLRLFGCKFGRGVFLDTTDITEFDCVSVGDFTAVNGGAALQTHLYEDRVMKVGRVTIGTGVTIGQDATVLYDTKVGDFARVGPLTIIMKGEGIPPHSTWYGAPAVTAEVASKVAETVPQPAAGAVIQGPDALSRSAELAV